MFNTSGTLGGASTDHASITTYGAGVAGAQGGVTRFLNTNLGFTGISSASGAGTAGGLTLFEGMTDGTTATLSTSGNGVLDFSNLANTTRIGALTGNGRVQLGSKNIQIASAGATQVFSGIISDGGYYGGTGGSVNILGGLQLTNANTYTGGTTVNAGVILKLGDGSANPGNFLVGSVASSGRLDFNFADNGTNGGVTSPAISGSGSVMKNGSGTLTVAPSTYTGGTIVYEGALVSADNSHYFGSPNGALLVFNSVVILAFSEASPTHTFNVGPLGGGSGNPQLIYGSGSGTVILTVGNGYTGTATLQENVFMGRIQDGSEAITGLTKTGTGTEIIAGNTGNTYTGPTTVEQGILWISSAQAGLGNTAVTVGSAGNLYLFGTIDNPSKSVSVSGKLTGDGGVVNGATTINAGGLLAPGQATQPNIGTFNLNGLVTLSSGSTFAVDLKGAPGTSRAYDQIFTTTGFSLDGDLSVGLLNGFVPSIGAQYFVLDNTSNSGGVIGSFANDTASSATTGSYTSGGITYAINYAAVGDADGLANDVSLTVVSVPEPSSAVLLFVGVALFGGRRRRS